MRAAGIRRLVEAPAFSRFVTAVIVGNAVVLGLETTAPGPAAARALACLDALCVGLYVVEAGLKLAAYRWAYFRSGWNIFDFCITALALVPASILPVPAQAARLLRVFRVLRTFRLVSACGRMRVIVEAVGRSLPGVMWTAALLLIIIYVFAVIGAHLFGADFPEYFGNLGRAFFSLFQIMTLEGWDGIARPIMIPHPLAWVYFVLYILASTFIMLNVVVGLVVSAIDEAQRAELAAAGADEAGELRRLGERLDRIEKMLERMDREGRP